ncbi:Probable ABC-type transport system, permease component [Flavobacterium indicum GPTSA100-9 = DSM 17447]|uniref:Probable ABC-type transport system, permease component n=1 Tax=Flavobacterium indicum (strain DSM 17447 / CIP 109464 / GPTSA100-9) TaxID=1094466 RepID=H8XTB8_FLAIG|nr:ABC transporter permease [Flavobacterium indicum]CCG52715.1 Probable ABC-type transport system, permease component [Flavobacterium indicum GPTSA100-9 = DSM 17447]
MIGLFKENTRIALSSIRTQILRTVLTVIIIAIGIMALVGILTVVSALDNTLLKNFASMGSNTFSISQYDFSSQINRNDAQDKINPIISYPQAKEFQKKFDFPFTTTSVSFNAVANAEVKYENKKTDPEISVLGIDENYIPNKGLELSKGRNLNSFDVDNNNYVCVVGSNFEKGLFDGVNPIDKTLSIRGAKFKVIGLLKEKGATFGNNQDLRIMIPAQIARSIFSAPNINYDIDIKVNNEALLNQAVDQATLTMRRVRKLNPIEEDNFGIKRSDDLIQRIMDNTKTLSIAAWVIGIITIFGSSIALMNIMLVSVSERTREIGIRKSLGATRSTIAWQFFTETFVISQLGGILGIILGILLGSGIAIAIGFEFTIPWMAMTAAFITTLVVTIFSGLYPAIKASKLDPVEALRYE